MMVGQEPQETPRVLAVNQKKTVTKNKKKKLFFDGGVLEKKRKTVLAITLLLHGSLCRVPRACYKDSRKNKGHQQMSKGHWFRRYAKA